MTIIAHVMTFPNCLVRECRQANRACAGSCQKSSGSSSPKLLPFHVLCP